MADFTQYNLGKVERNRMVERKKTATCSKCGFGWFERIQLAQYPVDQTTVLGQNLASEGIDFWFLRCGKCGEVHEPNIQIVHQDALTKIYHGMLDDLEKKEPEKK